MANYGIAMQSLPLPLWCREAYQIASLTGTHEIFQGLSILLVKVIPAGKDNALSCR